MTNRSSDATMSAFSVRAACRTLLAAVVTLSAFAFDAAAQRAPRRAAKSSRAARGAKDNAASRAQSNTPAAAGLYACPMHPAVTSESPGKCPKCKMDLRKREPNAGAAGSVGAATSAGAGGANAAAADVATRIPDAAVYDQDGRQLKFYSDLVKGRTVAINFIFTTCTAVCPTLTAKFRQLQQQLAARGLGDARLISISVDPVVDVPARLKTYAEQFKVGAGWTFVTGDKPEIDALLSALGSSAPDKTDHTSTALIINDPAGYRTRVSALSPTSTLADLVAEAAAKKPATVASDASGGEDAEKKRMAEQSSKYFPNHTLVTQDNTTVRFYDELLKGKIVLINFMFTTCTGVCSPMTANLAKVQSYLGERVGREVRMLSITVDPLVDTPEVLKAYAAKHKTGPGWYFLTGKKENVDWVLYKLGGYTEDKMQHTGVLIIGNEATGDWLKVHAMSKPSEIASAVVKMIEKGNDPKTAARPQR